MILNPPLHPNRVTALTVDERAEVEADLAQLRERERELLSRESVSIDAWHRLDELIVRVRRSIVRLERMLA